MMNIEELRRPPRCPCCGVQRTDVSTKRQRTAYSDSSSNYFTGCSDCQTANTEYWNERWEDYYSNLI